MPDAIKTWFRSIALSRTRISIQDALRIAVCTVRANCPDILIGICLACFVFLGTYRIAQQINPVVFEYGTTKHPVVLEHGTTKTDGIGLNTENIWFDGDLPKMMQMLTRRFAHYPGFTVKHPLFWPTGCVVSYSLRILGVESLVQLRAFAAVVAAVWMGMMFMLFRIITGRRLDAAILSILAVSSASAMFWLPVPEVRALGAVTIIMGLCLAALRDQRVYSSVSYVLVSAATLSMTVTNWMVGILVTFIGQSWWRALQLTVNAFFVVSILWGIQKYFIPSAQFFLAFNHADEAFVLDPFSGGPLRVISSFVFHTMVMPAIQVLSTSDPLWYGMSTQHSMPGSGTLWGSIAVVLWIALLVIGTYGLIVVRQYRVLRMVLAIAIVGQLALHLLYGHETFLHSMHWLPLLLSVVALGTLTRLRMLTLILSVMLVITCGINNGMQLMKAIETVDQIAMRADSFK